MDTPNNWIINLLKDNLREEIPGLAQYSSAVDIMTVIKNALRDRRRDAQKWLSLYNKQVEDDRHIENERDELKERCQILESDNVVLRTQLSEYLPSVLGLELNGG